MKNSTLPLNIVLFLLFVNTINLKAQCSIQSNIVSNSDFQSGNTGFSSSYSQASDLHPEGYYDVSTNPQTNHSGFSTCGDHTSGSGKMMVVNGATAAGVSVWCQTVSVDAYSTYTFSTWIASVVSTNPARLQFSINGVNLGSPFTASNTTCSWQQFCETWNSGAATSANICIVNQNTVASGNDFALDDIQIGKTVMMGVDISKFTAINYEQGTYLKWFSNLDENHDYFEVERSTDLINWSEIGKIYTEGDYSNSFEFFDSHSTMKSIVHYRLKSVDRNGEIELSTVQTIEKNGEEMKICPNPTFDKVFVWGVQNVTLIQIFNSMEVEQKRFSFYEHPQPLELDLSDLNPGIYFIKVFSEKPVPEVIRLVKR